jgi:hypothetical protein
MKGTVTTIELPTRSAILGKLSSLVDGDLSPEEASKWAETWVLADKTPGTSLRIEDWPAWEAVKLLLGADLQTEPGSYLHSIADFKGWLEALKAAPLPPEKTAPR